jgi:hypothetical protein
MTQLMWHFRSSVFHRSVRDVLNFTCIVESVGLYGSSTAFMGRSPTSERVMPAVIRSHAMSASSWYISCAGYVPPVQFRHSVQPLPRDVLELAKQVQLCLLTRVAPLSVKQPLGDVE